MTWAATVLTLYPEMFPGLLGQAIAGRALAEKIWSIETINIRDYAIDKHGSVDDTPAGATLRIEWGTAKATAPFTVMK